MALPALPDDLQDRLRRAGVTDEENISDPRKKGNLHVP